MHTVTGLAVPSREPSSFYRPRTKLIRSPRQTRIKQSYFNHGTMGTTSKSSIKHLQPVSLLANQMLMLSMEI
ncbi:hypothetical protein Gotri_010726 [Gossypium trilobum]|uniref:Uncharacterized protein n=1 Tax=Gossypium trilobum TaxID=34281 RepID=A0A7J9ERU9_9ROSI|nr:hypothetical protein [Gossypium trilobum]